MATILIDPVPAIGHYNGSLRLAHTLQQAGHRIVYIGLGSFREKVELEGFEFYEASPFLSKPNIKGYALSYWFDCFVSIFNKTCLNEALEVVKQYDKAISTIMPDLILLDSCYIQKIVIYGKYKVRTICFDTMICANYAPNIPPYRYGFVPKHTLFSKKLVDFIWFLYRSNRRLSLLWYKVLYFNNDAHSIHLKIASRHGVALEKFGKIKRVNRTLIVPQNLTELIIPPRCFDFPRPGDGHTFFIDPLVNMERDGYTLDERYMLILNRILESKKARLDCRFIYISLGTETGHAPKRELKFIRTLVSYCLGNKDHYMLFSIGKNYDVNKLGILPENLFIFQRVPQLYVLQHCDFMITHGGMNTLTECLLNEVPVIVYPLVTKSNWDQNGNSARVAYHQIGIKGNMNRMNVNNFKKQIDKMCANYNFFKANIKKLKGEIEIQTAAERAISIVESFIQKKR